MTLWITFFSREQQKLVNDVNINTPEQNLNLPNSLVIGRLVRIVVHMNMDITITCNKGGPRSNPLFEFPVVLV